MKKLLIVALTALSGCASIQGPEFDGLRSRNVFIVEGALGTVMAVTAAHPVVGACVAGYTWYKARQWDALTPDAKVRNVVLGGLTVAAGAAAWANSGLGTGGVLP